MKHFVRSPMPKRYRRRGVRDPMPMELRVEVSVVEIAGYNNKHRFITCTRTRTERLCVCVRQRSVWNIVYILCLSTYERAVVKGVSVSVVCGDHSFVIFSRNSIILLLWYVYGMTVCWLAHSTVCCCVAVFCLLPTLPVYYTHSSTTSPLRNLWGCRTFLSLSHRFLTSWLPANWKIRRTKSSMSS